MAERRRQSKAFGALGDEAFAEYKRLCLPRDYDGAEWTLERIVEWLAGKGLTSSVSSVKRDADHFRAMAGVLERTARAAGAAREIVEAVQAGGGVANLQAAAVNVYTNQVLDFLLASETGITDENVGAMSKLGATLSRLTASEIVRFRAEVERKAGVAAEAARNLSAGAKGDVKKQLADLADQILGVAK
jgi:hypothetical protein